MDEVLYQHRNVVPSFAQWRDTNRKHIQAIVQVHPESSFRCHVLKMLIRRRDDPRIDSSGMRASEPFELLLLDRAEELGLQFDWQIADFVEKQRAAVGRLEAAHAGCHSAGKRASLIPEHLALEQRSGNRRAVDRYKTVVPACARLMNGPRNEFLAGTRLALDKNRAVSRRNRLHLVKHGSKLRGGSNQFRH